MGELASGSPSSHQHRWTDTHIHTGHHMCHHLAQEPASEQLRKPEGEVPSCKQETDSLSLRPEGRVVFSPGCPARLSPLCSTASRLPGFPPGSSGWEDGRTTKAGLPRGLVSTLGQLSEHARPRGTSAEQTLPPSAHLNPLLEISVDGRDTAQEPAAGRGRPQGFVPEMGRGLRTPS